jgi:hypothetical protein
MLVGNVEMRDLSDLMVDPCRPLTDDEKDHFDEYMTFKNHDISAADVSITDTVDEVIADLDYYLGLTGEKKVK